MSDNREDIKTDLIAIAKLNSIINYDDKNSISRACEIIKTKNPFRSVYGRRYHQRLQEMLAGSEYPHVCITCQKPLDSSAPMCGACETAMLSGMQGSSNVTEKQNSTAAAGQVIEEKVLKGASTIKDAAAKSARSTQKAFADLDKDKIRESAEEGTKKIKSGGLKLFSRAKNIWNDLDKKQKIIVLVITAAALIILFTLGILRTISFCLLIFGISGLIRLLRNIKLTNNKQQLLHRSTILKVYVPLLAAIVLILAGSKTHSGRTISGMSSQDSEGGAEDTGGLTIGVDANGVKKNIIQVGSGYYLDIDESDKTVINNAEEATALIHKLYPEKDGWGWTQKPKEAKGFCGSFWAPIGRTNKYAEKACDKRINELTQSKQTSEATAFQKSFYQTETHYSGLLFNNTTADTSMIVVSPSGRILRSAFDSEPAYKLVGDKTTLFRVR